MRILLTNTALAHRTGSELYTVELALALRARGHDPFVYSAVLGELAGELAAGGVPVTDTLDALAEPPDLIHGHHHTGTLAALLHFQGVPGLFVCHGYEPWEEAPLLFPRLLRYVAVDLPTGERLAAAGIAPERLETILNFVDLDRFRPRPPLPPRPRRALVFSNNAHEGTHLPAVRAACAAADVELDVAGIASGTVATRPEHLLPAYDLVFAKARAAIEALAVGAAVVLCDAAGCGPMVASANLDRLRPLNFGFRTLDQPLSVPALSDQIARYDPSDAMRVSGSLRQTAGLDLAVARYLELYERILEEHRARGAAASDPASEGRAAAAYLRWLDPYLKDRNRALIDRAALWQRVHALEGERERLTQQMAAGSAASSS
ncbi:MAG TPA: glycosyltransferase family 4 protein [Thermoanaerobaculia bacterium]|nr:glycosyltransferase family 4 protein [Thermoanaerobaculia bacterium]